MQNKFVFNRKTYNQARKMDRQQMEGLIKSYYTQGYKEGFKDGTDTRNKVDLQIELFQFLDGIDIKGVGEKTKEKILKAYKERGNNQ